MKDAAARVDATLARQLRAHVPGDPLEVRSLHRIERLLTWLSSPLDEHADPTHVTGSAIVRDDAGRVLLHRHKRLGIWLQPGGHIETGERPWDAAVRETREETGIEATHPAGGPCLVHVDVHEGPRGHVHLDLRYLLHADGGAPFAPAPGESPAVDWFAAALDPGLADASLRAAVAAAHRR